MKIGHNVPWPEQHWSTSSESRRLQRLLTQVPQYVFKDQLVGLPPDWRTVLEICVSTGDQALYLLSNSPKARLFAPPTNRPARLQQAVFATRVLVDEGSVAAPLLPANGGPGLLDRMRRSFNPVHRLGASPQDDT